MNETSALVILIAAILTNNILLTNFLGMCSFIACSGQIKTAIGLGTAVTFVLSMTTMINFAIYHFVLMPLGLNHLTFIIFIAVIAAFVQFVEMFLKKSIPALYAGLGIFLPLITTNCAVMGACLLNIREELSFLESLMASFAYAVGFGLALILFAGVRERILLARVPKPLQDTAIGLVGAGMMSLAFFGFKGMA